MSELFPFQINEILFRTIDESCNIDFTLKLDVEGNLIYNIENTIQFESISQVGTSLEDILKIAIQKAFFEVEEEKIWIADLPKSNETVVIPAVLKELEKVHPVFGFQCEKLVLSFHISQKDMPMVQQLEKMRLLSKQPMPSIDSLDALINQALAQEWTCEVCGAKTKGLNCEYCDTPRKKVSFYS